MQSVRVNSLATEEVSVCVCVCARARVRVRVLVCVCVCEFSRAVERIIRSYF